MKCPFCGKEMKTGVIQAGSGRSIKWIPKEQDKGIFNFLPVVKGIYIADQADNSEAKTYYCDTCGKFIINKNDLRL